jgi:beta-phosphoglucomutase-like phosphatase (HAD superfamily)
VGPFSAVPDLLRRARDAGLRIAVASAAKKDELGKYLDIARVTDLVDVTTCSDGVEESKPAPDIFEAVLRLSPRQPFRSSYPSRCDRKYSPTLAS